MSHESRVPGQVTSHEFRDFVLVLYNFYDQRCLKDMDGVDCFLHGYFLARTILCGLWYGYGVKGG